MQVLVVVAEFVTPKFSGRMKDSLRGVEVLRSASAAAIAVEIVPAIRADDLLSLWAVIAGKLRRHRRDHQWVQRIDEFVARDHQCAARFNDGKGKFVKKAAGSSCIRRIDEFVARDRQFAARFDDWTGKVCQKLGGIISASGE